MAGDNRRLEHLLQLREELFQEMEQAEREWAAVRVRVERMDSDIRLGRPEPEEYQHLKGHLAPQSEAEVVSLFRQLLKLEDKLKAETGPQ